MEYFVNNIVSYSKQLLYPILFLFFVFVVSVLIRFLQEEWRDQYVDENKFAGKYIIAHGMACLFALIYTCIFYFVPSNCSDAVALVILILFYVFLIKIVMAQNDENGGYIEDLDGASGAIMYITSSLAPIVFVIIHALLAGICFWFYKREDYDQEWKIRIIKRAIDCGEALVATILVKFIVPDSFIGALWMNSIMIAVFTLIIPFINDWIYSHFE